MRSGVALECLEFPLSPVGEKVPFHWPDPAAELLACGTPLVRPPDDARWGACVAKLMAAVGAAGPARAQAVHRLAYLALYRCLKPTERDEFGGLLWSSRNPEKGGLPLDVDLFPHVIAALPGTAGVAPETVVRTYLFATPWDRTTISKGWNASTLRRTAVHQSDRFSQRESKQCRCSMGWRPLLPAYKLKAIRSGSTPEIASPRLLEGYSEALSCHPSRARTSPRRGSRSSRHARPWGKEVVCSRAGTSLPAYHRRGSTR